MNLFFFTKKKKKSGLAQFTVKVLHKAATRVLKYAYSMYHFIVLQIIKHLLATSCQQAQF